jgi:DNA-binding MurR/RpiR family transcriptional regulator
VSVLSKIQDVAGELTPAETRLVQSVIQSPRASALGTAAELAQNAGVHEATASRLARKLGFDSYSAFRRALRDEFIPSREPATRLQKTLGSATGDTILGTLVRHETEALARIEAFADSDRIAEIAERLMSARRIHLFGRGNAETLSLLMLKRFRRFGRDVQKLSGDPRDLAEQALGFSEGEVLMMFAFRRAPKSYAPLIESARQAGTKTIVVADTVGPTLSPQPDFLLAAPRSGDPDAFQTLTVPMTLCNAIVVAAGALDEGRALQALEQLGTLIERFD